MLAWVLDERGHRQRPADLHADLLALGVAVEALGDADTVRAAQLIAAFRSDPEQGSLSLGDGLCITTAERLDLPLTGGDCWTEVGMTVPYMLFR